MKDYGGLTFVQRGGNIMEIRGRIESKLDWTWSNGGIWTTCTEVAKHIGYYEAGVAGFVGKYLREFEGVKFRRSGGRNLVWVPRPNRPA